MLNQKEKNIWSDSFSPTVVVKDWQKWILQILQQSYDMIVVSEAGFVQNEYMSIWEKENDESDYGYCSFLVCLWEKILSSQEDCCCFSWDDVFEQLDRRRELSNSNRQTDHKHEPLDGNEISLFLSFSLRCCSCFKCHSITVQSRGWRDDIMSDDDEMMVKGKVLEKEDYKSLMCRKWMEASSSPSQEMI